MSIDTAATMAANQRRVDHEAKLAKGKEKVVAKMTQQLLKNATPEEVADAQAAAQERKRPIRVTVDDAIRKRMLGGSVPAALGPKPAPKPYRPPAPRPGLHSHSMGGSGRYWPDPTYLSKNRPGSAMSAARNKMIKKRRITWSAMIGGPTRALLQCL